MTSAPHEEPSGERFVPEAMSGGLLEAEHLARYRLVLPHVSGRRVLDAACGAGWALPLLVEAGATEVVGIDRAPDAVEDARRRARRACVVRGDLQSLPFAPESFDVVVCFETLEHVDDHRLAFDELVRVLTADGMVFVSSPNPRVYPSGNPFHVHELPPEELLSSASSRLAHVGLLHQRVAVSSLLSTDDDITHDGGATMASAFVGDLSIGHDPYSVIIASNAALPTLEPVQVLAPSDQLDHLDELVSAVSAERADVDAQRRRIEQLARERDRFAADLVEVEQRLAVLSTTTRQRYEAEEETVRAIVKDRDALQELATNLREQLSGAETHAAALREEVNALQARIADQDSALLVASTETTRLADEVARLAAEVDARSAELAAVRATVSWRVTAPIRVARRLLSLVRRQ